MPSIKSLRAFTLTMEQGSLTSAAQKMNLSQPAASRLLQQLEDEFGARLFYRDRKTLTPSREAELLYPEATRILSSFEELPQILNSIKTDETMPLKVVGQTRCILGLVAPALARLNKEHPEVPIELEVMKRAELRRRRLWDRFDVGVFALPLHVEFAEVRVSQSTACGVILPKSHPLTKRSHLTLEDLKELDFVTISSAHFGQALVESAVSEVGFTPQVKHEVSNAFAGISLVRNGLGFMIADRFTIDPAHTNEVALVPLRPEPEIKYAVCVSRDGRDHPMTARLIEILAELLKGRHS